MSPWTNLHLNVPLETTLSTGQERLYQSPWTRGRRYESVSRPRAIRRRRTRSISATTVCPTGSIYDATHINPFAANQSAVIPTTDPGVYYVLVRGQSEPFPDTPITLLAEVLPFGITEFFPIPAVMDAG